LFFRIVPLYAVGIGLILDEATFLALGGTSHADNYSTSSLLGTMLLLFFGLVLAPILLIPVNAQ
jgi:hypothetical protein